MESAGPDPIALSEFLDELYRSGGYDFRDYRPGTVTRRLARRLHATGQTTYREYLHFLDSHPEEYQKLADDLTIKVSGFFRSQYSFQQLGGMVLPELVSYKEATNQRKIRFWSVACALGEEPYSIAMLLAEFLGDRRHEFDILIQATDISQWAINQAQTGTYSPHQLGGLPESMKNKYFSRVMGDYKVRDDIRRMVDFSCFDLTSTTCPPFTELDGVFCCNVLIYWQRHLQERVLKMLYGALAAPGYLILGEVEAPTDHVRQQLACLDSRAKIYKKVVRA